MNRILLFLFNQNDYIHTDQEQRCTGYTAILHLGTARQDISKMIAADCKSAAQQGTTPPFPTAFCWLGAQIQTEEEQVPVT